MKKIYIILTILFLIIACDINVTNDKEDGILRIINNSEFDVNVRVENDPGTTLQPDEYVDYIWELDSDQTIEVFVEYWIGGGNSINTSFTVEAGYTTTYDIVQSSGDLDIENGSSRDIWYSVDSGDEYTLGSGNTDYWTWDNLLEFEDISVNVDYSGFHVFSNSTTETVTGGYITDITIEPDGGGIKLQNNLPGTNIIEVYISPSEDQNWGENDLTGYLAPGSSAFWTVEPGDWDIKAVDEFEFEYTNYNNNIVLDETSEFYVGEWKRGKNSSTDKKNKDFSNVQKTTDRVEFKIHKIPIKRK